MNLPNVSLKVLDTGFDTRLDFALSVNPFVVLQCFAARLKTCNSTEYWNVQKELESEKANRKKEK